MAQRSLRDEKRKIKYDYVLAVTGNVTLARAARSWSVERIKQVYRVEVNYGDRYVKAVSKLIPETPLARKRRYNAFVKGKVITIRVKPLKPRKPKKKYVKVGGGVRYEKPEFIPIPVPTESTDSKKKIRETPLQKAIREANEKFDFSKVKETKVVKKENWIDWTKEKLFPADIMEVVEYANRVNNRTIDDSYGYAIAHLMYTENLSFEDANKIIIPDRFEIDVYTRNQNL